MRCARFDSCPNPKDDFCLARSCFVLTANTPTEDGSGGEELCVSCHKNAPFPTWTICPECSEKYLPAKAAPQLASSLSRKERKMEEVQTPVTEDAPVMVAWERYKKTESYANARKWAMTEDHVDGSMWSAFERGFSAAENGGGDE